MSIILKGIDLPQKLYTDIRIYKSGRIKKIIGENTMISYSENVQAIQISKDHGRIIDENEAIDNVACFHGTAWLDTDGIKPLLEAEENK